MITFVEVTSLMMAQHICNKCGKELANRHSLSRHRNIYCKVGGARVGEKRSANDMSCKSLISTMEFDRLVRKPAVEWSSLTPNTIYKLVWVYDGNGNIIGNLDDGTGGIIPTLLPQFVVVRLLELTTEQEINIFLRPRGGEEVDIAVAEKLACENCEDEFASPVYLNQHMLRCGKKAHRCSNCRLSSGKVQRHHCEICNTKFTRKVRICDRCGKQLASRQSLWNHKQICTGCCSDNRCEEFSTDVEDQN